jgi:alkylhydroperoxidase family enzyme
VTLNPSEIVSEDLAEARRAGLSDRAILDAAYVCAGFNIIARIADALGFDIPSNEEFSRAARLLVIFGYRRLSGFWTVRRRRTDLMLIGTSLIVDRISFGFDPYDRKLALLRNAVLSGPGSLSPAIRQAISEGGHVPGALGLYVKKVAEHAYKVTDDDIASLRRERYTDDQIFEATVSAALGAGLLRLDSILHALRPSSILPGKESQPERCAVV